MFDLYDTYSIGDMSFASYPVTKPNIRTGEGRMKVRRGATLYKDQKKKAHRKMAKKSRRTNRR